ncbi:MAG: TonB-dependent receptor [Terracidiphilus sp.]|jgi:TonB-dependent receptor
MKRLLFLSFLLLLVTPLIAMDPPASKGTLTGRVTDATGAVIQNAAVQLTPSGLSTTTNSLGEFILAAVPPGEYILKTTSVGFSSATKKITVASGQSLQVDLTLTVASSNEQVVVSAESGQSEIQAVNQEIESPNIVQVMPAAQILSLPNANVADAVGRLPGVTLQRDEGEGVYVQVRGMDPRLTNVTIDGVTIPSPEAAVRQINLATIPSDMIQSIELNKTLSANQDADGIGGSVNLVTKMAGETPTFTFGSSLGITPVEGDRYVGKIDTTVGRRFGPTKRWGILMGAGYDYNGRGINDIEPASDVNPDGSTTPYYDNITLREYRYQRLRWGGTMGADYKLSDHSSLNAHLLLSDFKDWGDKWYYEVQTQDKPKFYESQRRPDFAIGSASIGGNHIFNTTWVTWGSAISRSRELNSGGNPKVTFNPAKALKTWASNNCDYVPGGRNGDPYKPQWSPACMTHNPIAADDIYNLNNYTLNEIVTTQGQAVQLNLQEWASLGLNYHVAKHSATLEYGGEFRNAHKFQNAETPSWDAASGIGAAQFQSGFRDPDYYSGNYTMGPVTNYGLIKSYFKANSSNFSPDINDTHGGDSQNFDLIERVSSAYIMNTINWDRFRLQTGLRIEGTQLTTSGFNVATDGNGNWVSTTPTSNSESYWDPLPSVQARWAATPTTALRAVFARGISRPNQYDLVPYTQETDSTPAPYSIGNPQEKPTHANNFDLLLEQQLKPFGLIQAGFFYKQLGDPIVTSFVPYCTAQNSSTTIANCPAANLTVAQQNTNASNAKVLGLEFNIQQRFSELPGALSGLGFQANYAYTESHTNGLPERTDSPALVGTARHSYNIEPSYELKRFSAHVGISYNSSNVYAYQFMNNNILEPADNTPGGPKGPLADNYFYPHLQFDAQASARIYRRLQVVLNGLNLNNEVFGFYNGSPQFMTQREYYKPTYSASLRWTSGSAK